MERALLHEEFYPAARGRIGQRRSQGRPRVMLDSGVGTVGWERIQRGGAGRQRHVVPPKSLDITSIEHILRASPNERSSRRNERVPDLACGVVTPERRHSANAGAAPEQGDATCQRDVLWRGWRALVANQFGVSGQRF